MVKLNSVKPDIKNSKNYNRGLRKILHNYGGYLWIGF